MSAYKLSVSDARDGIAKLMQKFTVIAPVMVGDKLDYAEITDAGSIVFSNELPYKSPKEVVLPRVENVMRFTEDSVEESQDLKPILLIGAKPCDIAALRVLDEVFTSDKGKFKDTFYINRRNVLTIVGMNCTEPKSACFCFARGIDKAFSPECDGFLTQDGENLVYEELGEKGRGLFEGAPASAPKRDAKPAENLVLNCTEEDVFTKMPWDVYAEGCIGCGTCTYICPTCHCFNLRDAQDKGIVNRTRVWDSCMYPKFTLHAGGHNPRSAKKERFRQRVLHKYMYIPENYGYTACTGCGRCIRSCPGGLNIMDTVYDIKERTEEAKA